MVKKSKTDKDADPKAAAVQHMKEALARVQAARAAAHPDSGAPGADRGGKGPKPPSPKGRMFRHQGR
jgi:hypothetical protein